MSYIFSHRHLLNIASLSPEDILFLLERAEIFAQQNRSPQKKSAQLAGKTIVNLFFEPSTRTRTSFEIAAKRLGADVVNVNVEHSSTKKGETLSDTVRTLDAMQIDGLVIRHVENGVPDAVAAFVKASVINAGDGTQEHPTQALLDALTIRRHKKKIQGLTVAICGDIAHSRVARSNVQLLTKLGARVRLVAPSFFMTPNFGNMNVAVHEDMASGLKDVDVVMMLRIQHERMAAGDCALSLTEYHQRYGLDHAKLAVAKQDAIVLHPGPVNRGVEMTDQVADDPAHSVIREQVEMGVAVRMAVLETLVG